MWDFDWNKWTFDRHSNDDIWNFTECFNAYWIYKHVYLTSLICSQMYANIFICRKCHFLLNIFRVFNDDLWNFADCLHTYPICTCCYEPRFELADLLIRVTFKQLDVSYCPTRQFYIYIFILIKPMYNNGTEM